MIVVASCTLALVLSLFAISITLRRIYLALWYISNELATINQRAQTWFKTGAPDA